MKCYENEICVVFLLLVVKLLKLEHPKLQFGFVLYSFLLVSVLFGHNNGRRMECHLSITHQAAITNIKWLPDCFKIKSASKYLMLYNN